MPQPQEELTRIDFKLAHAKEELLRIYDAQEELLAKHHGELRDDFNQARTARLHSLIEHEKQNFWLIASWLY